MKTPKGPGLKALEKELLAAQEKLVAEMVELEKRLAQRQILRTEYHHERGKIEDASMRCAIALSTIRTGDEMEGGLAQRPQVLGAKTKNLLDAALSEKNRELETLKGIGKKIWAKKEGFELARLLKQIHSSVLESQRLAQNYLRQDDTDRLLQAHILGSLEERLHSHKVKEMTDEATLRLADEFVIDVPKKHSGQGHERLKRESGSRLAKR